MYIKNLILKNYRNYSDERFEFSNGINILIGNNAQGKTNCAEAIFYLCSGYSPRVARDKQVVKYGENKAIVIGSAESNFGNVEVSIEFSSTSAKSIKVNGTPIKKIGELMGNINAVFFNPDDLKLIKESPDDRRRFMDVSLSQMSRRYFYALKKYKNILDERNSLLKNSSVEEIEEVVKMWNEQLMQQAKIIENGRLEFLKSLAPKAQKMHAFLTDGKEELQIIPEMKCLKDGVFEDEFYLNSMAERLQKDIILGYTTLGPHRDDLKITLNGEDVRTFGSQGQQRTASLSLKLAELEIFKEKFNEYPVFILDDALSELDVLRRKRLLEMLNGKQTIITSTELFDKLPTDNSVSVISIENGKIIRR